MWLTDFEEQQSRVKRWTL